VGAANGRAAAAGAAMQHAATTRLASRAAARPPPRSHLMSRQNHTAQRRLCAIHQSVRPCCSVRSSMRLPEATTRVAIIGLGRQGSTICDEQPTGSPPFGIAGACAASASLQLVAGCDLLPDRRNAFRDRWGAAVYADFHEMIEKEQPQLVAICTAACLPKPARRCPDLSRPDAHADLCVAVSELGVPMIFCEKAVASSVRRLDDIRRAFRRNATALATGQFRRYDKRFEVVRDAVGSGAIGKPTGAVFFGASSLLHGHVHTIDTLSYLLGDPGIARVRGELLECPASDISPAGGGHIAADPLSTYQLLFKNGVVATAVQTGPGATYEFEIIGTEGSIRCWCVLLTACCCWVHGSCCLIHRTNELTNAVLGAGTS
jgi:predicted dehydrogenase